MLNYHHLYYFYRVARAGSMARASKELELTQPTISEQVRLLEKSLGHRLFDRVGRSLILTETGKAVLERAERIFAIGEELGVALNGEQKKPRLRVRLEGDIPAAIVAHVLKSALVHAELEFTGEHPDLALTYNGEGQRVFDSGTAFLASKRRKSAKLDLLVLPGVVSEDLMRYFRGKKVSPEILAVTPTTDLAFALAEEANAIYAGPDLSPPVGFRVVARAEKIRWRVYAVARERRVTHPAIRAILGR